MIRGTRQAICDALAHAYIGSTNTANFLDYLCRIDRSSGNQAMLMAIAVQYAKVRAAISAQREPVEAWLIYCYGPDLEALHKPEKQELIAQHVTQSFKGPHSLKKQEKMAKIAHMAVLDYRLGQVRGVRIPLTVYMDCIGLTSENWHRDWEKYRNEALDIIKAYETEGIGNVSKVVKAIRESEKDS